MDWPRVIPLFPLPNVVLLPGPLLPLHVFEPRYRAMVRDVEANDGLVGMVLLRPGSDRPADEPPPTFAIGCAGQLVKVEPLADGRSNILLRGARIFRIEREVGGQPYRQAEVEWLEGDEAELTPAARAALAASLRDLFAAAPAPEISRFLDEENVPDVIFVNFWSFALEVPILERQALLEEATLAKRAERLREVIRFRLAALRAGVDAGEDPGRFH